MYDGYTGHFKHTLDNKGRTSFPADFRKVLAKRGDPTLYLTIFKLSSTDGGANVCVWICPANEWEQWTKEVYENPAYDDFRSAIVFNVITKAVKTGVDDQGRLLISPDLRREGGLGKEVYFVGLPTRIELLSKEEYEKRENIGWQTLGGYRSKLRELGLTS